MSAPVSNPKPRFFPWYVTLAGPLVLMAISLAVVWRASSGSQTQNFVMGDRNALVTATDVLDAAGATHTYNPRAEVVRKEKLPRGGRSLSYSYEDDFVKVKSVVLAELDAQSAATSFRELSSRETSEGGVILQPEDCALPAGDERLVGTLLKSGVPIGQLFLQRTRAQVVLVHIEGPTAVSRLGFHALVKAKLEAAHAFTAQ